MANTDTILDALLSAPAGIYSVTGLPYRGDGYVVAIPEFGAILDRRILSDDVLSGEIAEWIEPTAVPAVTTRPAPFHRPRYLAASITAGTVRLDVVEIFPREEIREAIAAAQDRNQAVIWDAGRQEVIDTTV